MFIKNTTPRGRSLRIAILINRLVFIAGLSYLVIFLAGLYYSSSSHTPIGEPFFSCMEIIILLISPLMTAALISLHYFLSDNKTASLAAVIFMAICITVSSAVHFSILTLGHHPDTMQFTQMFSFRWPSVVYALDILAWDWFFALSMLAAAISVWQSMSSGKIKYLMLISSILSVSGLAGTALSDMSIRNIGIAGYGLLGPVVFLFIAAELKKIYSKENPGPGQDG